ncbi:helix-turn-helix domain-containing protein [Nonomuraea sp. NPDC050643]|uniref:helix-turn-helix domain-containing protein n=1 Tax=Nonomuraea sp. NPDC050643 TaxID=3155660 RepID=UPI0033C00EB0
MIYQDTTTRGRRERPVPPGPLQEFAQGLRDLRAAAGNPSYRAMERKAGYSSSALSAAASGDRLPSLSVTKAYVGACGGDQDAWARKWNTLRADLDNKSHDGEAPAGVARPAAGGRPAQGRLSRRAVKLSALLVALGVTGLTGLVTAGALGDSVLFRSVSTTGGQPKQAPQAPDRSPAFTAVAGPSCPRDTTRSVRIDAMPGRDGWKDAGASGWTGAGCGDSFLFSELTYDARAKARLRNAFQWRFTTGLRGPHQCTLTVYVPRSGLAGQRVWYTVSDGFDEEARTVGEFTLDQRMRQGQWVPAPVPLVVTSGLVIVEITDTGRGNTTGNQAMAAGPVRLSCP